MNRHWNYVLVVHGLPIRYYSEVPPPVAAAPGTSGFYQDRKGITYVGPLSGSLDPLEGVAEYSNINIKLTSDGTIYDRTDPVTIFSRLGPRAASGYAKVLATIPAYAEAPLDILVDTDLTGLSYPRLAHVGLESFWVTSCEDNEDGTYILTASNRAVLGTRLRDHQVRLIDKDYPALVTDQVVYWRSRSAVLLRADIYPDGTTGSYTEVMRGLLDLSPNNEDNYTVSLDLAPALRALDSEAEFTVVPRTTLVEGYHYFTPAAGNLVEVYHLAPGGNYVVTEDAGIGDGSISVRNAQEYALRFDPTLNPEHPRAGNLDAREGRLVPTGVLNANPSGVLELDPADPLFNIPEGAPLVPRRTIEAKRAALTSDGEGECLVWPGSAEDGEDGVFNRLNAAFFVNTNKGYEGSWSNVQFQYVGEVPGRVPGRSGGPDARILFKDVSGSRVPTYPQISFFTNNFPAARSDRERPLYNVYSPLLDYEYPEFWLDTGLQEPVTSSDLLFMPWCTVDTRIERRNNGLPRREFDGATYFETYQYDTVSFGSPPLPGPNMDVGLSSPYSERGDKLLCALAWYQAGEEYMLFNEPLTIGRYQIKGSAPLSSSPTFYFEVVSVSPLELSGGPRDGETVYLASVTPQSDFSFAIWPLTAHYGDRLPPGGGYINAVTPVDAEVADRGSLISDLLVDILTTPNSFGWTEDDLDLESIRAIPDPPFGSWSVPTLKAGVAHKDFLRPLLVLTRSSLVMRTDDSGRNRVTRIDTSAPSISSVRAIVEEQDWGTDPIPSWRADDSTVNNFLLEYDYDSQEDDFKGEEEIPSTEFTDTAGDIRPLEFPAYALKGPLSRVGVLPTAQALFQSYGPPKRVWSGRLSTAKALGLSLGDSVQVSSPFLRGFDDTQGVTGAIARVSSLDINLWEEGAMVEFVTDGAIATGWNVCMRVEAVVNDFTLQIAETYFTDGVRPGSSIPTNDLRLFCERGQLKVYCVPIADQGAKTENLITEVDFEALTITLDEPHGLAAGDFIDPPEQVDADDIIRQLGYLDQDQKYV